MSLATTPSVSICVPAYNQAHLLASALKSALAQTAPVLEILVSDNCSTDETQQVAQAFAQRDVRVRYERTATHLAMPENFTRCLELARGEYIKFLCADDMLEPNCVERLLTIVRGDETVSLAACARRLVDESGEPTGLLRFAKRDWSGPGADAARRCFYSGNLIGEPTAVMFRRSQATGGFNPEYFQLMDLEMWFRVLEQGRFAFLAEPLCSVRRHRGQATEGSLASGRVTRDKARLFRDYGAKHAMRGTVAQRLLWDFRMAWSQQRELGAGRAVGEVDAVFYPALAAPMRAGAGLAWALRGR